VATRKHLDVRLEINCKLMGRVIPGIFDGVVSCLTAEKAFHNRHMLDAGPVTIIV
jgi:hypothetical protein